jgi:nucleoside phosphorylase
VKTRILSAEQQKRVNIVWDYFKKSLEWPLWKALLKEHAAEFGHVPIDYSDEIHVGKNVSLDFKTILTIPEARQLLQPLPELLRLAARRFIEHPTFDSKLPRSNINNEDFSLVWPDRVQRTLAYTLLTLSPISTGGGRSAHTGEGPLGPDWFSFDCSYSVLRYENVSRFDEALEIASHHGGVSVGVNPTEQHQRFMQSVFAHAIDHGNWPLGLPFAIEHRKLGYIPQLVDDLTAHASTPAFVRSNFDASSHRRICLNIWALPFIDPSGKFRSLLTRAITIIAHLWKQSPANEDRVTVSLTDLSDALGLPLLETAPVALLLENEPWASGGNPERYENWCASITSRIWQYRAVASWEEYLEARTQKHGPPLPSWSNLSPPTRGIQDELGIGLMAGPPDFWNVVIGQMPLPIQEESPSSQTKSPAPERKDSVKNIEAQRFDVAIICALRTPELEKLLNTGNREDWKKFRSEPSDPQTYHQGSYTTSAGTRLRLIAAAMNQMGPPAAAALAAKMILRFRPRLMAMVGIAAGAKVDPEGFGDILAPDVTFDHTSGKFVDNNGKIAFNPDPRPYPLNPRVVTLLKDWQADGQALIEVWRHWPGPKPKRPPRLIIGPLASGGSVVANRTVVDDVELHWRKLIGLEMEAYAVHCACRDTVTPETPYLAFKAVCDFADGSKNDEWQPYAAYTAAESLHRFLVTEWESLYLEPPQSG